MSLGQSKKMNSLSISLNSNLITKSSTLYVQWMSKKQLTAWLGSNPKESISRSSQLTQGLSSCGKSLKSQKKRLWRLQVVICWCHVFRTSTPTWQITSSWPSQRSIILRSIQLGWLKTKSMCCHLMTFTVLCGISKNPQSPSNWQISSKTARLKKWARRLTLAKFIQVQIVFFYMVLIRAHLNCVTWEFHQTVILLQQTSRINIRARKTSWRNCWEAILQQNLPSKASTWFQEISWR